MENKVEEIKRLEEILKDIRRRNKEREEETEYRNDEEQDPVREGSTSKKKRCEELKFL